MSCIVDEGPPDLGRLLPTHRMRANITLLSGIELQGRRGDLIEPLGNYEKVVFPLQPKGLFEGDASLRRHLLRSLDPLRRILIIFDALFGVLEQRDIREERKLW